jgi:autotransporter passenger strand-loop-strand repeat protein
MNCALRGAALRLAVWASAALMGALGLPSISAAETNPDFVLPQGLACKDFALGLSIRGGNQVYREFTDRNGNVVRLFSGGKGNVQTFTNMTTGEELTIRTGGSVTHTTINSDGSQTVTSTGHNVWILFPTDVPAGPTTTLYLGKVVFRVDPQTFFSELLAESAQKVDICAALSI